MSILLSKYKKIEYEKLHTRMQESYNFQKASAVLADYGFVTNLLKYDWMGADFLAQHVDGDWLKVQLKGRLTAAPIYEGKSIFIMFEDKETKVWYLYPHDQLTAYCQEVHSERTFSKKGFSTGRLSKWQLNWLNNFKIIN